MIECLQMHRLLPELEQIFQGFFSIFEVEWAEVGRLVLESQAAVVVDGGDDDPGRAIVVTRCDKAVDDILELAALDRQFAALLALLLGLRSMLARMSIGK